MNDWFDKDSQPLPFGKGRTPDEIAEDDPSYIVWLHGERPDLVSVSLAVACEQDMEDSEGDMFDHFNRGR